MISVRKSAACLALAFALPLLTPAPARAEVTLEQLVAVAFKSRRRGGEQALTRAELAFEVALKKARRFDTKREIARHLLAVYEVNERPWQMKYRVYEETRDSLGAIRLLLEAGQIELARKVARKTSSLHGEALVMAYEGKLEQAVIVLDTINQQADKGRILLEVGRVAEAADAFAKASEHYEAAEAYEAVGNRREAQRQFELAAQTLTTKIEGEITPLVVYARGMAQRFDQQPGLGRERSRYNLASVYERAAVAYEQLAVAYAKTGKDRALTIKLYRNAIQSLLLEHQVLADRARGSADRFGVEYSKQQAVLQRASALAAAKQALELG